MIYQLNTLSHNFHTTLYSSIIVLYSFRNCFVFHYEKFLFLFAYFLFAKFFCSIWNIFCSLTFFVPFGIFFANNFTPPRRRKNNNKASFRTFEHSLRSKSADARVITLFFVLKLLYHVFLNQKSLLKSEKTRQMIISKNRSKYFKMFVSTAKRLIIAIIVHDNLLNEDPV